MIIYAPNIHQGGGKVLLKALLSSLSGPSTIICDSRLQVEETLRENVKLIAIFPSIYSRLKAEFLLRRLAGPGEIVLCFGNLPPLLPIKGKVNLYFQNVILLEKHRRRFSYRFTIRLRHYMESLWLRWRMCNVDQIFLQSRTVEEDFLRQFPHANVTVAPFYNSAILRKSFGEPKFDFVFVSSGDSHKNHRGLLRAWKLLAQRGYYPRLALTLSSRDAEILEEVKVLRNTGVQIDNFQDLSHSEVVELYLESKALIFPSFIESFGLPLIEASQMGIPILASELDYVREFVSPVESFDPNSDLSMARAVARFMNYESLQFHQEIYTPDEFLKIIKS